MFNKTSLNFSFNQPVVNKIADTQPAVYFSSQDAEDTVQLKYIDIEITRKENEIFDYKVLQSLPSHYDLDYVNENAKVFLRQEVNLLAKEHNVAINDLKIADELHKLVLSDDPNHHFTKYVEEVFLRYILDIRKAKLPDSHPDVIRTHTDLAENLYPLKYVFHDFRSSLKPLRETPSEECKTDIISHYNHVLKYDKESLLAAKTLTGLAILEFSEEPQQQLQLLKQAADIIIRINGYKLKKSASSEGEFVSISSSWPSLLGHVSNTIGKILEQPGGENLEITEWRLHLLNLTDNQDLIALYGNSTDPQTIIDMKAVRQRISDAKAYFGLPEDVDVNTL